MAQSKIRRPVGEVKQGLRGFVFSGEEKTKLNDKITQKKIRMEQLTASRMITHDKPTTDYTPYLEEHVRRKH